MRIFGYARRQKGIVTAVQTLREHGLQVTGPYRTRNAKMVFSVADYVVTEAELLELQCNGKLNAKGIAELFAAHAESKSRSRGPELPLEK